MPRQRTGTIHRSGDKLRARVTVTMIDGSTTRVWIDLDASLTDAKARAVAAKLSERLKGRQLSADQLQALRGAKSPSSTVAEFFRDVYCREVELHRYQLSHWKNHILPVLGREDVRVFGADPLRELVEALDEKIESGALGANTAGVIWSVARKFCGELVRSKRSALRIRTDNPAANVQGPNTAPGTEKQWLYPSELWQLLAAETTPLELARFVALQVYLCCRPGEAYALRWSDIDLGHEMVRISQSRDPQTRVLGPTKGREVRSFRLPAVALPMLRRMRTESPGDGFLFSACPTGAALRAALLAAGVTRSELHSSSSKSRALRTHDGRATGLSYLALMGHTDDEVRERAGHKSFATTLLYLRRGKQAGRVGDPLRPLPSRLVESSTESSQPTRKLAKVVRMSEKRAEKDASGSDSDIRGVYDANLAGQHQPDIADDSEDEWLSAIAELWERAVVAEVLRLPRKAGGQ